MNASSLRDGDMVHTPDGRMGVIVDMSIRLTVVTFGADGPFGYYPWRALRRASMDEIRRTGLYGVGCNQAEETIK